MDIVGKDNEYCLRMAEEKSKQELQQFSEQLTPYIHWVFVGKLIDMSSISEDDITVNFTYSAIDKIDPYMLEKELQLILGNISDCIINLYSGIVLSLFRDYNDSDIEAYILDDEAITKERNRIMSFFRQELSPVYTKLNQMKPQYNNLRENMDAIIKKLEYEVSSKKLVLDIAGILYRTATSIHNPVDGIISHIGSIIKLFSNTRANEIKAKTSFDKFKDYAYDYEQLVNLYNMKADALSKNIYSYLCTNVITPWINIMKMLDSKGCYLNNAMEYFYTLYERTNDVTTENKKLNEYFEAITQFSE